jgi:hypothetical protein
MNQTHEVQNQIIELIKSFQHKNHQLQARPAIGKEGLVFADVVLINKTEEDPTVGSWIKRRVVRTDMPQVFIWLFKKFVPIIAPLPGYGLHKEEIFGRLGNTVAMVEELEPAALPEEKVAAVIQDFWEICQDLIENRLQSLAIAVDAEVMDDFVTRSIKSGFVDRKTFEDQLFGEAR